MLSAKNLKSVRPKKKYLARFVGPFKIEARIGTQAYRLTLPEEMGKIHLVFHVSLLEPYHRSADVVAPPPNEIEAIEEYELEAIRP